MEDLEQECEDALFALSDARERLPLRCAEELKKSIRLNKEINMMKVATKVPPSLKFLEKEQDNINGNSAFVSDISYKDMDSKLDAIASNFNNLKNVVEQIEREKDCDINKLLKD